MLYKCQLRLILYCDKQIKTMKKNRRPKLQLGPLQIKKPFPVITLFLQQLCQKLLVPANKVQILLNERSLQNRISRLNLTASLSNTSILVANQVGLNEQLISKWKFNTSQSQSSKKWIDQSYNDENNYQCFINPEIVYGKEPTFEFEESISFPFIQIQAWRYNTIRVKYETLDKKSIERQLTGWDARIFQHGYDYFYGRTLIDWRLHFGKIKIQPDIQPKLPKTTEVIQQYSSELAALMKEYEFLPSIPDQCDNSEFFHNFTKSEILSIQKDFVLRIAKHYRKQMLLFMERLELQSEDSKQQKNGHTKIV